MKEYRQEQLGFGRYFSCRYRAAKKRENPFSTLPAPMHEDCANLAEATIDAGHSLMLKAPSALDEVISSWLREKAIV